MAVNLEASFVLKNEDILNERVSKKINEMGEELYKKTGVSVYIYVVKRVQNKKIGDFVKGISKDLRSPFILLFLARDNQKVDIYNSSDAIKLFDKDMTLSPFSWSGSIIPILANPKMEDKYNVAMLNGYADIAEQVAKSKNIKLESAIGSTNRTIYHILRYGIYGFLIFVVFGYFYQKRKFKNE